MVPYSSQLLIILFAQAVFTLRLRCSSFVYSCCGASCLSFDDSVNNWFIKSCFSNFN